MSKRDSQRQRVYDAERRIIPSARIMDKSEARRFFKMICKVLPECQGARPLRMTFRRGGVRSFYDSGELKGPRICILRATKRSICHEIAHHVTYRRFGNNVPDHGREFAGILASMLILFCEEDPTRVHRELSGLL